MSPENENPAGAGDISEDELRKILGDDYDSVVGKDADIAAGDAGPAGAVPAPEPVPAPAPEPPPVEEGVVPNMTAEEAEAWAAQVEAQMAQESASAPAAAPAASSGAVPAGTPVSAPASAPVAAASAAYPPAPAAPVAAPALHLVPPAPAAGPPVVVQPVQFAQIEDSGSRAQGSIDVLLDVRLPISVELGRTEMEVKEILECGPGTVIELSKLAGEPVDIFINGRLVAQGEVVVVDEHFGVRVTSLLSPSERVRSLA